MRKTLTLALLGPLLLAWTAEAGAQDWSKEYETTKISERLYTFWRRGVRNIFVVTDEGVIANRPDQPGDRGRLSHGDRQGHESAGALRDLQSRALGTMCWADRSSRTRAPNSSAMRTA